VIRESQLGNREPERGAARPARHASAFFLNSAPPRNAGGAVRACFADGRWHFQHGPIDLVIGADGEAVAVGDAMERAWRRFRSVLPELVVELPLLRLPVQDACTVTGAVARRMVAATWPHCACFITPMAAVAGAVADELIKCFRADPLIERAYVNNGGDIALHLTGTARYRVGMVADIEAVKCRRDIALDGEFEIAAEMPVRGVATSGWRGRSFSLGIADSVTVLARSAAEADAAATMIANQVNAHDPAILRRPANALKDDTDLGERLVTVEVGALSQACVETALASGERAARVLTDEGRIHAAALWLQGSVRVVTRSGKAGTISTEPGGAKAAAT
jgi:uncharacterized protein